MPIVLMSPESTSDPARYSAAVALRRWIPPVAAASVTALALAASGSSETVAKCTGSQLAGTFSVVPGSPGAGSISYVLHVRLVSGRTCFVSGLPGMRLLDRLHRPLPTNVVPAFRPGLTAVRIVLSRGRGAKATARFSPDVPGAGEPVSRRACERTASYVRVIPTPGRGTFVAPVKPPTPVCEHGGMSVSAFSPA
jgi:Domain of unknown function (DUF4232)